MREWIKVEDRLPENLQTVLIYHHVYGYLIAMFDKNHGFYPRGVGRTYGVSHWMPLPEPPESP